MTVLLNQNDFTHGELDPLLESRVDLVQYTKSVKRGRNGMVLPQGGFKKRFGTIFQDEIIGAVSDQYKLEEFKFSTDKFYTLVFTNTNLAIYLDNVKVADVVTPYTVAQNNVIKVAQTVNLLELVHPAHPPQQLVRGGDDFTWTFTPTVFEVLPAFDFRNDYSTKNFILGVVSGLGVTLTSSAPQFDTDYVGGAFVAAGADPDQGLGHARITSLVSPTEVTVDITVAFSQIEYRGVDVFLGEPAFSATRGFPQSVTFYQQRLYFGGTASLPNVILASRVGDFINFDVGVGRDDQAIVDQLSGKGVEHILHLVSDRSLGIFTDDSEFSPPDLQGRPLTPSNENFQRQSNNGSEDVEPVVLDNQIFFVKKGAKGIMNYLFDNDLNAYRSTDISLFSTQLIRNPVDSGTLQGSFTENADFLFFINADGTLAIFQTLLAEQVAAWTLSATKSTFDDDNNFVIGDKFKRITAVGDTVCMLVERLINGQTKTYLERLSFDVFSDSSVVNTFGSPTTTITGLDHLEGEEVFVRGDGFVFANNTVVNGQIELADAATNVQVGLGFDPLIEINPPDFSSQEGTLTFVQKRLVRLDIDFFESIGIEVKFRDELIEIAKLPFLEFGENVLDQPPTPISGREQSIIFGWNEQPTIVITQSTPSPFTIRSLGYKLEAGTP